MKKNEEKIRKGLSAEGYGVISRLSVVLYAMVVIFLAYAAINCIFFEPNKDLNDAFMIIGGLASCAAGVMVAVIDIKTDLISAANPKYDRLAKRNVAVLVEIFAIISIGIAIMWSYFTAKCYIEGKAMILILLQSVIAFSMFFSSNFAHAIAHRFYIYEQ